MNGCVIKGTPIAVDFWRPTKAPEVRLFFLTHLHQDHTQGLSSTWRLPIYTSPINALLLVHKFKLPKSIIRELEVGETYLLPLDPGGDYTMSVTPLDANHVPGAVMFLFQGYFGNILYSGDMRWYPELVEHSVLKNLVEAREVDVLYLDNTFSAPFCRFPSREEAKKQLFDIIECNLHFKQEGTFKEQVLLITSGFFDISLGKVAYLSTPTAGNLNVRNSYPDHTIKISVRELGREDLLEAVARHFQERILVNQDKFKVLELLQYSDAFTNDPKQARIHAVPMSEIQVRTHQKWNENFPTISIILTALFVGWPHGPYTSQANKGIFMVPYSDHSSYDELIEMVGCLKPRRIIPIVEQWSKHGWWADPSAPDQSLKFDMTIYDDLLTYPPPDPILIPEAITRMMSQGGPMMVSQQPRRCALRRGMAPRPRRAAAVRGVVFTSPERLTESPDPSGSITLDVSFQTETSCSAQRKLYFPGTGSDVSGLSMGAYTTPKKTIRGSQEFSLDNEGERNYLSDLRHRIIARTKALAVSHCISLTSEDANNMESSDSELLRKAKEVCQSLSYVDELF